MIILSETLYSYKFHNLKVAVEEFVDDYERPVLEKYEKFTPTPIEKKKKVHFHTTLASLVHTCYNAIITIGIFTDNIQ